MNILPLIEHFTNTFNESFNCSLNPFDIERKIKDIGDSFTIKLYEEFLSYLDLRFKNSEERKKQLNVKETSKKTLITTIGIIKFNSTSYYSKDKNERYVFMREVLALKPYQRVSNEGEFNIVKEVMNSNMSEAGKKALRGVTLSRSAISKRMAKLDGSIKEDIKRTENQPDVLYIEMDEIHANLQKGGNRICPCAIVHEGHKEDFVKRKELKNPKHFASAKLSYEELWEVIYDYVDKKYDISKFKAIFVSGDGANGIKNYTNCFPEAKYVYDKFHYKKDLRYLFKNNDELISLADSFLRRNMINEFNLLIDKQIKLYKKSEDYIIKTAKKLIKNTEGIKHQNHELYKCPCSMEGQVSNKYARYITSSPFGFSLNGLNNKIKLLVYKANKVDLKIEDHYNLKNEPDEYINIVKKINELVNIKYDHKLSKNLSAEYKISTSTPKLDTPAGKDFLKKLTSIKKDIRI
ncbi:MAG: UPF0236 family protein [Bacilli bacterium]|nr:UPF0236 family protein [Bacilli bacterium]